MCIVSTALVLDCQVSKHACTAVLRYQKRVCFIKQCVALSSVEHACFTVMPGIFQVDERACPLKHVFRAKLCDKCASTHLFVPSTSDEFKKCPVAYHDDIYALVCT